MAKPDLQKALTQALGTHAGPGLASIILRTHEAALPSIAGAGVGAGAGAAGAGGVSAGAPPFEPQALLVLEKGTMEAATAAPLYAGPFRDPRVAVPAASAPASSASAAGPSLTSRAAPAARPAGLGVPAGPVAPVPVAVLEAWLQRTARCLLLSLLSEAAGPSTDEFVQPNTGGPAETEALRRRLRAATEALAVS